eukprot:TRINITY_DN1195_c0_g1_i1.p1 TRINITY_DN1195_c0_g1~~TRINITY_DN1195_c0_g1_i1.p1  ORF type:complete len:755 (+),score=209.22 TRINITY_DN1195_c0_g1_i1:53-2317(+)
MGGKGKGKGKKGSGKGKGKARNASQQTRRELRSFVGQVLGDAGEDTSLARGGKRKKGKGKGRDAEGKAKGKGVPAGPRPSRRAVRRNARKEKKQRRAHYFGGKKNGEAAGTATDGKKTSAASGAKSGQQSSQGPAKKKRKRYEDDDEEITSDEEGGPNSKKDDSEDEEEGEEADHGSEIGEEGEEEEEGSDDEELPDDDEDAQVEEDVTSEKQTAGSYVPPHLRAKTAAAQGVTGQHARQLRGLMNRVTEGNLDPSCRELVNVLSQVVPELGSAVAADACMKALLPAAVADPNISVLVVGCFAALTTACQVLFGASFGAAALLQCAELLRVRLEAAEQQEDSTSVDARVAKNCVIFEMLLFSFGLLPGSVVFDIVRFVLKGAMSEVRIELSLTILRFAGRALRSECPDDFREVLKFVTSQVSGAKDSAADGSEIQTRLDYLLKELSDLKNNKVSFAVMDRFNQTRGWLQSASVLSGKKVSDHALNVPFRLLEDSVPSGWPLGGGSSAVASRKPAKAAGTSADPLRAAAIAQRLSSEIRQSLFVALMGAEDFEDAAQRLSLVASGAKSGVGEACIIIFHCAVREKVPNAFYAHVANALCSLPAPAGKRFSHNVKRAAVQHMQQAHGYGMRAAVCLAELCAALIASSAVALPLSIVRFMKFGGDAESGAGSQGLGGILGLLLRHMIESLMERLADPLAASAVFAPLKKYEDVREGLLLVLDGQVRPRLPPQAKAPMLWEKFRAARKEVAAPARSME